MARAKLSEWRDHNQSWLEPLRTTLMGGIIFMIPILVIGFALSKLLKLVGFIVEPIADMIGADTFGGVSVVTILTVIVVILIAYLCGLFARTSVGQGFMKWIESGVVSFIPAFNVVEGFAKSLGPEGEKVLVVLVPTDAGWATGLVFEPPKNDWYAVFLPGSPEWVSGSVSYAHVSDVHVVDISVADLAMIMRRRGIGSERLLNHLAKDTSLPARETATG